MKKYLLVDCCADVEPAIEFYAPRGAIWYDGHKCPYCGHLCTVTELAVPEDVEALASQFEARAWCKDINPEVDAQMAHDLRAVAARFAALQREVEELREQLPEGYEVGSLYLTEKRANGEINAAIELRTDGDYEANISAPDGEPGDWRLIGDNYSTPAEAADAIAEGEGGEE